MRDKKESVQDWGEQHFPFLCEFGIADGLIAEWMGFCAPSVSSPESHLNLLLRIWYQLFF